MRLLIVVVYGLINLLVLILYGADKERAKRDMWRIPERTLILCAVPGAFGALLGMILFRHKTRKAKFYLTVPLLAAVHLILIWLLISSLG